MMSNEMETTNLLNSSYFQGQKACIIICNMAEEQAAPTNGEYWLRGYITMRSGTEIPKILASSPDSSHLCVPPMEPLRTTANNQQ